MKKLFAEYTCSYVGCGKKNVSPEPPNGQEWLPKGWIAGSAYVRVNDKPNDAYRHLGATDSSGMAEASYCSPRCFSDALEAWHTRVCVEEYSRTNGEPEWVLNLRALRGAFLDGYYRPDKGIGYESFVIERYETGRKLEYQYRKTSHDASRPDGEISIKGTLNGRACHWGTVEHPHNPEADLAFLNGPGEALPTADEDYRKKRLAEYAQAIDASVPDKEATP